MKATTNVRFQLTNGYDRQNTFPVLAPSPRFDPEQSLIAHLRDPSYVESFEPVKIEGLWGESRFVMKMIVSFKHPTTRQQDYCVVYGYTEPCTELMDETKIYLTRILGLARSEVLVETDVMQQVRKRYDILLLAPETIDVLKLPDANKFVATPRTIAQRISASRMFSMLNALDTRQHFQMAIGGRSQVHSVDICDIDVVTYAKKFERAIKATLDSADPLDMAMEDTIHEIGDRLTPVDFRNTRLFDLFCERTHYPEVGYITHGELVDILGGDATFEVDFTTLGGHGSGSQTVLGERIFNDHLKMLVTTASNLGMEKITAEWFNDNGTTDEVVGLTEPLFHGMSWQAPRDDDDWDFEIAVPGELIAISKPEPEPPVDSREFYGVNSFRVKIDLDFAGDIHGTVNVDGGAEQRFVKPAFSLTPGSGFNVTENEIDTIARTLERYIEYKFDNHGSGMIIQPR